MVQRHQSERDQDKEPRANAPDPYGIRELREERDPGLNKYSRETRRREQKAIMGSGGEACCHGTDQGCCK